MTPKNCFNCRALYYGGGGSDFVCRLGYKIREDEVRRSWGKSYVPVPTEKCPKPRTWKQYDNADRKPFLGSASS